MQKTPEKVERQILALLKAGMTQKAVRENISYKRDIAELCEKAGMSLPEEYFLKIPPEVDDNYMANLKQQARVDRLKQQGDKLSLKKTKFVDDGQLEFG